MTNQESIAQPDEARLAVVAAWVQSNVKLAAQVMAEGEQGEQAPSGPQFETRGYQLEAWDAIWTARQGGKNRALVHLATGLGKTSVGVVDFLKFREERLLAGRPEPRGLFISHQDSINRQAAERFALLIPAVNHETHPNVKRAVCYSVSVKLTEEKQTCTLYRNSISWICLFG